MGEAPRFLGELDAYLGAASPTDVRLVGRGRRLGPRRLARRERTGPCRRAVALNNVAVDAR
jgi:hypothetical protein